MNSARMLNGIRTWIVSLVNLQVFQTHHSLGLISTAGELLVDGFLYGIL